MMDEGYSQEHTLNRKLDVVPKLIDSQERVLTKSDADEFLDNLKKLGAQLKTKKEQRAAALEKIVGAPAPLVKLHQMLLPLINKDIENIQGQIDALNNENERKIKTWEKERGANAPDRRRAA